MAEVKAVNHLSNSFYTTPSYASQIMTYVESRETLAATQGFILSCGEKWEVTVRHKGAGMYLVTLGRTWLPKSHKDRAKVGEEK